MDELGLASIELNCETGDQLSESTKIRKQTSTTGRIRLTESWKEKSFKESWTQLYKSADFSGFVQEEEVFRPDCSEGI